MGKMKIFDCFTFFNELDLLEFRLKFLDAYIDFFVIAESNLTHSGLSKPYHFQDNTDRFIRWKHKIIYIPIKQNTEGLLFEDQKNYNPQSASWKLENEQRNALLQASSLMKDSDTVLLSDLDEIPSGWGIKKGLQMSSKPAAFSLLFHVHYLNCQHSKDLRWWKGCIMTTAKQFKEITPQGLRDKRDVYPSLPDAGWHFSFMGGVEKIQQKLQAFAHTEYGNEDFSDRQHIEEAVLTGKDVLKRDGIQFKYMPLSYYPAALQKVMKQYPHLLHLKIRSLLIDLYYLLRRIKKGRY
jgi:beta-1,4-mannosyl-glycoprotein beta-1,4-N-acetylglucosaminyltransferase